MSTDQIVPIVAGLSCFVAYAAGTVTVFRRDDRVTIGLVSLTLGAIAAGTTELATMTHTPAPSAWHSAAGTAIFVGALALFLAAARETRRRPLTPAFSGDVPEHLVSTGPYRLVRHPFYTAYLLTYLAGWAVTGAPTLVVVCAGMTTLYAVAARQEERKFEHSPLAHDYARYAARTGMFWPAAGRQRADA